MRTINIFVTSADSNYFLVTGRSDLKNFIERERGNNRFVPSDTKGISSASLALVQNVQSYAWRSKCLNIDLLLDARDSIMFDTGKRTIG